MSTLCPRCGKPIYNTSRCSECFIRDQVEWTKTSVKLEENVKSLDLWVEVGGKNHKMILEDKAIKTLARELYIADTLHAMWRADPLWWQGAIRKDYYEFRLAMIANQDLGLECEEIKPFMEQAREIMK